MPIYEYRCEKCGNKFEKIAKYDDVVSCDKCGCVTKKVPPLSNFHLKGGCWSKDGYSK